MYPNIIIGNMIISSWYISLLLGIVISTMMAIYLRPHDFPIARREIFGIAVLIALAGLFGARILFILLHWKTSGFRLSGLFSLRAGFAYFGALLFSISTLWLYSFKRRLNFLSLLDYGMPFLMLSQVFVRIGCLLVGCCYGKPTDSFFGVVFKTVDGLTRHPTQAYEAALLILIYLFGRMIYKKNIHKIGFTTSSILIQYGLGRFFIEYLRTDSPIIFSNLTLAQIFCLSLALVSLFAFLKFK